MYTVNLEVVLVVTSPNINSPGNTQIMILDETNSSIPSLILDRPEKVQEAAAKLLKRYTNLQAIIDGGSGWITLIQAPIIEKYEENKIIIGFGCMIPQQIRLRENAKWIKLREIVDNENEYSKIIKKIIINI